MKLQDVINRYEPDVRAAQAIANAITKGLDGGVIADRLALANKPELQDPGLVDRQIAAARSDPRSALSMRDAANMAMLGERVTGERNDRLEQLRLRAMSRLDAEGRVNMPIRDTLTQVTTPELWAGWWKNPLEMRQQETMKQMLAEGARANNLRLGGLEGTEMSNLAGEDRIFAAMSVLEGRGVNPVTGDRMTDEARKTAEETNGLLKEIRDLLTSRPAAKPAAPAKRPMVPRAPAGGVPQKPG